MTCINQFKCPKCGADIELKNRFGNLLKVCAADCGYRICVN